MAFGVRAIFPKIRLIHAWSGLVLSVLVAVLSLSGSALIFKDDYLRAVFPEAKQTLELDPMRVGAAIERIESRFGAENLAYVLLAHREMALHKVVMRDGAAAYARQSGEVVTRWEENGRVEDWLFHLHHYLFMGEFGKYLAGVIAICAVLMAASGIYLVTPFLPRFRGRFWPKSSGRQAILAHHRDLGVMFVLPILLITLTGAAMVFFTQASAILAAVTLSEPTPFGQPAGRQGNVYWPAALEDATSAFPDAQLRLLSWPRADDATASIRMRQPSEWHQNGRTYAYIDPRTSNVVATRNAEDLSRGERAAHAIYPLHSTGIGGRVYDIVAACAGLALTMLALLAAWSFLRMLLRRRSGNLTTGIASDR